MNDQSAQFGPFRAKSCEWIQDNTPECCVPVIAGKTYCINHFKLAYRSVNAKFADKEYDRLAKDPCMNQSIDINQDD